MKNIALYLLIILTAGLGSCRKRCDCTRKWDRKETYVRGDLVSHKGRCWEAREQGSGIEPGPWMHNGNDIWVECD
jgi:hypothetical protein